MKTKTKSFFQIISLVAVDLMAYYLSLFLAVFARTKILHVFIRDLPSFTFSLSYVFSMWWVPAIYIFIFQMFKLYYTRFPFWEETRNIVKGISFSIVLVFFIIYVRGRFGNVLRALFVLQWFFTLILIPFFRFIAKKLLYKIGLWKENVIILGAGENAIATIQGISREEHLGYNVVGFLDDDPRKIGTYVEVKDKKYKIYGEIEHFAKFVEVLRIQTVFIAVNYDTDKLTHLINSVYKYVRRAIIVPDIRGVSIFNSELHYLFTEKLFMINVHNSLHSRSNMIVKRVFDVSLALLGFLIISPFFLIIALLVKITSKGPVLYGHTRIGKDGKEFKAWKFRSMYADSQERLKHILDTDPIARQEWEASYKLKKDPRVTPIGRFLRKFSIDEFPQLFNVIGGNMSLVGPRPVIQEEIDKYYKDYKDYYYSVPPGMTGLWQVSGRSDTDYDFRVQTDVWYIQNWSLWLDVMILMRTPLAVLKSKGAY